MAMPPLTSVNQINLQPKPGKTYFAINREWREEFIYFLLVDRFQDNTIRIPVNTPARSAGTATPNDFYGGTIRGVMRNLDYIAGLGCTAIWLSPLFQNNPGAYHGYNINNYLNIDPHFGTKEDLVELVEAAHNYKKGGQPHPIRIILDVVINHSGDNWFYKGEDAPGAAPREFSNDLQYEFGGWRPNRKIIPEELQNPDLYHRRGLIASPNGYDTYPENQHGDLAGLKDFANDDDANGSTLINILIKAHCYWIREADIDGFRVDAVKHMGELACSRFSSAIREYAYSLGKQGFFLFGELAVSSDDIYNRYIGQNTSRMDDGKTVFFGLNSLLDFRLAQGVYGDDNNAPLRDVIRGIKGPQTLFNRLEAQRDRALNRGEIGRYLVTFVDNHDTFWQPAGRFGAAATDAQIIAAIGFLLCSLGTPCIYYGTEQGFKGKGEDNAVREALFDKAANRSLLNTHCTIYQEIAKIAGVMRASAPLRFGRMYYRQISGDGIHFGLPYGHDYTLAFSRVLYGREVLVAYNVSSGKRSDFVVVDATLHKAGDQLHFLYGKTGSVSVQQSAGGALCVKLELAANGFVVLE
ncbi:MAG: alpha-amylase [Williamsia sp.]|nr:alpha-amylase [Williamsia sp.]